MNTGPSTPAGVATFHPSHRSEDSSYVPLPIDIVVVREMLSRSRQSPPPDIIDAILDYAEYWAHSGTCVDYTKQHKKRLRIDASTRGEDKFLLRSFPIGLMVLDNGNNSSEELAYNVTELRPLPFDSEQNPRFFKELASYPSPRLVHPVRKIVFSIKSKAGGRGVNRAQEATNASSNSWTWFEVGLERFDASQTCEPQCALDLHDDSSLQSPTSSLPLCALRSVQPEVIPDDEEEERTWKYRYSILGQRRWGICRNDATTRKWQNHVITWDWRDDINSQAVEGNREFVRCLKMGDVVSVWGKARFSGVVNKVRRVKIDIYWAL